MAGASGVRFTADRAVLMVLHKTLVIPHLEFYKTMNSVLRRSRKSGISRVDNLTGYPQGSKAIGQKRAKDPQKAFWDKSSEV